MATTLLFRRGDTATSNAFTGTEGELFVDTQKDTVVVHDGTTQGGHPLATETYVDTQVTGVSTYVDTQISNLIDSAPGALDTLNELAAALGDDANFATTVTNSLATKLAIADFGSTTDAYLTGGTGITYTSGTIAIDSTADVTFDVVTGSKFYVGNDSYYTALQLTTTSTTPANIAAIDSTVSRSMKAFVQGWNSTSNLITCTELLITHDGTTAISTQYGTISSGAEQFTIAVSLDAVNNVVIIEATPTSADTIEFTTSLIVLGA